MVLFFGGRGFSGRVRDRLGVGLGDGFARPFVFCHGLWLGREEVHCLSVLDLILSRTLYFLAHMKTEKP